MKVVINRCYGGFNLSNEAVERCLELGMILTEYSGTSYRDLDADFVVLNDRFFENQGYGVVRGEYRNSFRSDPRVVQAVEELGEKANGPCSTLRVIDIPFSGQDGWEVDEYDGLESIVPIHQRWS